MNDTTYGFLRFDNLGAIEQSTPDTPLEEAWEVLASVSPAPIGPVQPTVSRRTAQFSHGPQHHDDRNDHRAGQSRLEGQRASRQATFLVVYSLITL